MGIENPQILIRDSEIIFNDNSEKAEIKKIEIKKNLTYGSLTVLIKFKFI